MLRVIAALCIVMLTFAAAARDNGQYQNVDPVRRQWFKNLMQPDLPEVGCCDISDCIPTTDYEIRGSDWYVKLGPKWVKVPENKIITDEKMIKTNPTGTAVVCWNLVEENPYIFCFVPGNLF